MSIFSIFTKKELPYKEIGETLYDSWSRSEKQKKLWKINGWRWIYKPFWYCRGEDDSNKGARCAECDKWIERKDRDSLQIHEIHHWD